MVDRLQHHGPLPEPEAFLASPSPLDEVCGAGDKVSMTKNCAQVLIDGLPLADAKPYTYFIPHAWRGHLRVGLPVLVPFGPRRDVSGYIVDFIHMPDDANNIKPLEDVVIGEVLPPALQALLPWLAEQTMATMLEVLTTAMPRGTLSAIRRTAHLVMPEAEFAERAARWTGPPAVLAKLLLENGGVVALPRLQTAVRKSGAVLSAWRERGWIRYHSHFVPPERKLKTRLFAVLTPGSFERLTPRQAEVVAHLQQVGGVTPLAALLKATGATRGVVSKLESAQALAIEARPVGLGQAAALVVAPDPETQATHKLTPHQTEVVAALLEAAPFHNPSLPEPNPHPASFLLHGVTGSGKTEVYMQVIAAALEAERGAIVLVPEIALTPQTVRRFQERFGDLVAVLHSHLCERERYEAWQRIRSGDAPLVIGARSAIFAPIPNLGVIIIDEEHESSYKQDNAPRYHARMVAKARCEQENALLILGSATPSVESYAAANRGELRLLEMPERVECRPLPPVAIADMRTELKEGNRGLFSRLLKKRLAEGLARGEQTILLLNRRGYSSFVFCRECGYTCKCQRCSVAMTYHTAGLSPKLRCHYCNAEEQVPAVCPQCHGPYIRHFGAGTQQIEEALARLHPEARILRVDRDTTSHRGSHERMFNAFGEGRYDVLIGTQMVAKGLDFPNVTLVGVMAADSALNLPDFRASERTFQLLSQVAGRAGRHTLPGQVVIQTYNPQHVAIRAAAAHDYRHFFEAELPDRQALNWPPYTNLVNVMISAASEDRAKHAAECFAEGVAETSKAEVFGAHEAPIYQIRGMYRFQVVIKSHDMADLRPALKVGFKRAQKRGIRISVDIDPYNLL